mmetsp:Transcript_127309/g.249479  ORF Transcript_127309/g.249479 Transcript_127309/m.249479 type:complete len:130 (+) Transcript_127309:126-515(+)
MGNCCASEEVKAAQKDITEKSAPPKSAEDVVPSVKAGAGKGASKKEWTIKLEKKGGKKLGIDVDLSVGDSLVVESITDGLMQDWNKANPDKAVKEADQIVAVNGTRGKSEELAGVCQKDDVLEMVIVRN